MGVQHAYTTLGAVQQKIIENHAKSRGFPSFPAVLESLHREGMLLDAPPPLPVFSECATAEAFDVMLQSLPVDASIILRGAQKKKTVITEPEMFPWEKDVFAFKHMPYLYEEQHFHDYFEITYIYKGNCRLLFGGDTVQLTEGEICIIPPQSPHNQPLDASCVVVGIAVRSSTFDSIFGSLLTKKDLVSTFFRNSLYGSRQTNYLRLKTDLLPEIRSAVQHLVYESNRNDAYSNACAISFLNLFLAYALRQYSDTITLYRTENLDEKRTDFAMILQYLQQNFRTVTLSELAKTFHYSETYLCKLIQRNLNKSFTEIIRSLKLSRAQHYLLHTDLKIHEIAEFVGYDSVDHFSRTFKKVMHASPAEYRLAPK